MGYRQDKGMTKLAISNTLSDTEGVVADSPVELEDSSNQIAAAFPSTEETAGIGIGTWLFILLLVLALIAVISYLYNRALDEKTTRLPYN